MLLPPNDPHIADDPLPEDASDGQAETVPASPEHQITTGHETPSQYDSDSDNDKSDKPLLDLNDINKLNANTL